MGSPQLRRVLGLADVVLFNVVVIFSVRGMTTAAKMGPLSILLWLLAVVAFFIPMALTVTELATRDCEEGGFYRWTRDALGDAHGFLTAWFYWVSNVTYLPSLLLSGFMFPFRGMPVWAQWLGEVFPLTHFLRIVRGIMLKGNGFAEAWPNLWPLVLFLVAVATLAVARYQRTLD